MGYPQSTPSIAVRRGVGYGRGCGLEEMFCGGPCIYCSRGVKGFGSRMGLGCAGSGNNGKGKCGDSSLRSRMTNKNRKQIPPLRCGMTSKTDKIGRAHV